MRCKGCHYELAHLSEKRCPECGRLFDPNDPMTFDPPRDQTGLWLLGVALAVIAFLLFAAILAFWQMIYEGRNC